MLEFIEKRGVTQCPPFGSTELARIEAGRLGKRLDTPWRNWNPGWLGPVDDHNEGGADEDMERMALGLLKTVDSDEDLS